MQHNSMSANNNRNDYSELCLVLQQAQKVQIIVRKLCILGCYENQVILATWYNVKIHD